MPPQETLEKVSLSLFRWRRESNCPAVADPAIPVPTGYGYLRIHRHLVGVENMSAHKWNEELERFVSTIQSAVRTGIDPDVTEVAPVAPVAFRFMLDLPLHPASRLAGHRLSEPFG